MRTFFSMPRWRQWLWASLLCWAFLLPMGALAAVAVGAALGAGREPLAALGLLAGTYVLLVLLFPLWVPLAQFATAPMLYLLGHYRYYSPMLLVEGPSDEELRIHGGTNFDYFVHFAWSDRGPAAARKTLQHYLRGLLALADAVERGEVRPETRIVASSYIFTARTARRVGFTPEPIAASARWGLYGNYLNLLWKHSFAKGRLAPPDLRRIGQAATTGAELVRNRDRIVRLLRRLERSSGDV